VVLVVTAMLPSPPSLILIGRARAPLDGPEVGGVTFVT